MGDFFKGWRRKAGCVLLLLAWGILIGWLRSFLFEDTIVFEFGDPIVHFVISARGSLGWGAFLDKGYMDTYTWEFPAFHRRKLSPSSITSWIEVKPGWFGIGVAQQPGSTIWVVPYWLLALPLTLLSGWLILGKRPKARAVDSGPSQI